MCERGVSHLAMKECWRVRVLLLPRPHHRRVGVGEGPQLRHNVSSSRTGRCNVGRHRTGAVADVPPDTL